MKNKTIVALLIVLSVFLCRLNAQTIERSGIVSGAHYNSNVNTKLQSNIGEVMSDSYFTSQNIIIQGYIQPEPLIVTSIVEYDFISTVRVFPNPVSSILYVDFSNSTNIEVIPEMMNLLGEKVDVKINRTGFNAGRGFEINMEGLIPGVYFLRIKSSTTKLDRIFKITKS